MTAVTGPPSTCGTASPDDLRELSQVQRDQWFLHTLSPEGSAYNTGVAVRIRSALDLAALKRAVRSVGERHEMFRSTFAEQAGRAVRRLLPLSTVTLTVRDCAGLSAPELHDAVAGELRAPFRLSEQPPFRIALFVSAADDAVLLVTGHHIATDASSDYLVLRDLLRYYAEHASGVEAGLAPLRADYDDHVSRERKLLDGEAGARMQEYWQQVCQGSAPAQLPADRDGETAAAASAGSTYQVSIAPDQAAALTRTARELEVSPFALLLGALQALVSRTTRQSDFLIGCPVTVRTNSNFRDLVGNFTNVLVFRARISPASTFRELAVEANRQVRAGADAIRYPSSLLTRAVGPSAGSRGGLYAITFNLLSTAHIEAGLQPAFETSRPEQTTEYAGLRLAPFALPQQEGQLDLGIDVLLQNEALTADFRYDAGRFDRATVAGFAAYFVRAVELAVADPDARVARAPIWGPGRPRTPSGHQNTETGSASHGHS